LFHPPEDAQRFFGSLAHIAVVVLHVDIHQFSDGFGPFQLAQFFGGSAPCFGIPGRKLADQLVEFGLGHGARSLRVFTVSERDDSYLLVLLAPLYCCRVSIRWRNSALTMATAACGASISSTA